MEFVVDAECVLSANEAECPHTLQKIKLQSGCFNTCYLNEGQKCEYLILQNVVKLSESEQNEILYRILDELKKINESVNYTATKKD